MMTRGKRATSYWVAVAIACSILGTGAAPANAMDLQTQAVSLKADQETQPVGYVVAKPQRNSQRSDGTMFFATGPVDAETLVVIPNPDGSLPGGLSISEMNKTVQEAETANRPLTFGDTPRGQDRNAPSYAYSAAMGSWSQAWSGSSLIGSSAGTQTTYSFRVNAGFNQRNAGQGLGYYRGYSGSTLGVWSQWYGLGAVSNPQTGYGTVPWGNVAAVKKFKAQCLATAACGGYFTT